MSFLGCLCLFVLAAVGSLYAGDEQTNTPQDNIPEAEIERRFDIKKCRIVYRQQVPGMNGLRIAVFDDWGARMKTEERAVGDTIALEKLAAEFESQGVVRDSSLLASIRNDFLTIAALNIRLPYIVYTIDLVKKTGTRRKTVLPGLPRISLFEGDPDVERGTDVVLGRECTTVHNRSIGCKIWIWQGVVLREENTHRNGQVSLLEAISIDENVEIAPDEFAVPEGIDIQETGK